MIRRITAVFAAILLVLAFFPARSDAYAVLAHEALIDATWQDGIRPLLLARFPAATGDDLRVAHGYAYGGAIIQDMGYYPHGSRAFSDIVHYVRSADFIRALLRDSTDINEYAFALGALSHYWGDNEGHSMAVNLSVPMLYPKLQHKYGNVITYAEDPAAHLKT
ncbi:MAG: zinc dependent phospholipase C family protein, partial [Candidatus Acidiferrales bacterium]